MRKGISTRKRSWSCLNQWTTDSNEQGHFLVLMLENKCIHCIVLILTTDCEEDNEEAVDSTTTQPCYIWFFLPDGDHVRYKMPLLHLVYYAYM